MIHVVNVVRNDTGWTVIGEHGKRRFIDHNHLLTAEKAARHYLFAALSISWADTEAVRVLNACEPQMHDRDTSTVILERSAA